MTDKYAGNKVMIEGPHPDASQCDIEYIYEYAEPDNQQQQHTRVYETRLYFIHAEHMHQHIRETVRAYQERFLVSEGDHKGSPPKLLRVHVYLDAR